MGLTEQPREQRHQNQTNQGNAAASHHLFHTLAFGPRVVVSVTFQKVDRSPDTKTCSQSDNESLKYIYRTIKKAHVVVAGILGISLVYTFLNTQKPE